MRALLCFLVCLGALRAASAAEPLEQAFQNAILAEESRRDLNAAIRGYEDVVARVEAQRSLAATAVFRLGECYRKAGRTNDAVLHYQRLLRDYPGEATLVRLSQQNLAALGVVAGPGVSVESTNAVRAATAPADEEDQEIARLQALLHQSPDLLNGPPGDRSPLYDAAEKGRLRVVQTLLSWNADANRKSGAETPLHAAAGAGHRAVVAALLDAKADPNVPGLEGRTPFSFAAGQGYVAVVQEFLRRGVRPEADPDQRALYAAVAGGHTNIIDILVKAGARVDAVRGPAASGTPYRARTPLEEAVRARRWGAMRALIRLGATVVAGPERGEHPLDWALFSVSPMVEEAVIRELLAAMPVSELPPGFMDQRLRRAVVMGGREGYIPLLLGAGASVESRSMSEPDPLICVAVSKDSSRALELLLAAKPKLDAANPQGMTALHLAVDRASSNLVQLLLQAGANPNLLDAADRTPLSLVRQRMKEGRMAAGEIPAPAGGGSYRILSAEARQSLPRIEALLLEAGASEEPVRRLGIYGRRGTEVIRLARRSHEEPPPTLADAFALCFSFSAFSWADLEKVRILRWTGTGKTATEEPVLPKAQWWNDTAGCDWNQPLQWGDVVEIPELDHRQGESWRGLPEGAYAALVRCTSRNVTLRIQDRSFRLALKPTNPPRSPASPSGGIFVNAVTRFEAGTGRSTNEADEPITIDRCVFSPVIDQVRGLFRTSSDLTQVRVTRKATGRSWTFDVTRPDPRANDFWLLDGDIIEVPEKEKRP